MATSISPKFKQIDVALAQYYQHLDVANYSDSNNSGLFLNYIQTEELDDPQLPIEEELGDKCNPYHCTYTRIWVNTDNNFPIPSYAQIPDDETEAFIFYILQHCHKYGQPPSDYYIQTILVPQCNGTINVLLPANNNQVKFDLVGDKALCSFEDHLATFHVYQVTTLVNCYVRVCSHYIICNDIINCIQLYLLGEEGAMYCIASDDDSMIDDDDAIAHMDNGQRLTAKSNYAIKYYNTVSTNKTNFCAAMKLYYKASYGKILKIFEELQRKAAATNEDSTNETNENNSSPNMSAN